MFKGKLKKVEYQKICSKIKNVIDDQSWNPSNRGRGFLFL